MRFEMILNPYHHLNFFQFLEKWLARLYALFTGELTPSHLASDEIQIFVLMSIAVSSALVGTFLVLRRMAMLANALSHTILIGIVIAYVLTVSGDSQISSSPFIAPMQAMLVASLLTGFLTAFLTEFLATKGRVPRDASIGLVFTTLFALGIILATSLTRDAHIGIESVMGNVDALQLEDLKWVLIILIGNVLLISFFFKEFTITTFDSFLALSLGFSTSFFNYLLMAQVSATSIVAFRAVGVLLVLSFLTGPVLTARLLTDQLKQLLYVAIGIGVVASLTAVALTRHILTVFGIALSTSGVVVCVIALFYLLAALFAPRHGLLRGYRRQIKEPSKKKI